MACEVFQVLSYFALAIVILLVVEYFRKKPQIDNISSKSVFITGCDTGFGNLLAKRLDGLGCRVFAGCYTQKGADELQSCSSHRMETLLLDVTNTDSIKSALRFVKDGLQPDEGLWGLVNNAGIVGSAYESPEYVNKEDMQKVLEVNLLGVLDMIVHFLPLVVRAKGRIVNMASLAGRISASPHIIDYNVSKYGVEALSDGLRPHMKKYGCHVCILEPGLYATNIIDLELSRSRIQYAYNRMSSEDQEALGFDYVDKTFANLKKNLAKIPN